MTKFDFFTKKIIKKIMKLNTGSEGIEGMVAWGKHYAGLALGVLGGWEALSGADILIRGVVATVTGLITMKAADTLSPQFQSP